MRTSSDLRWSELQPPKNMYKIEKNDSFVQSFHIIFVAEDKWTVYLRENWTFIILIWKLYMGIAANINTGKHENVVRRQIRKIRD